MRSQANCIIAGGNGSGKTTYLIKQSIDYLEHHKNKRWLWTIPDDSERKLDSIPEITEKQLPYFTGMAKIIVQDSSFFERFQEIFSDKNNNFNGCVCNDDPGVFLSRRDNSVLSLMRRRRQLNIDFLWAFHGWSTEIPPSFFTYVTHLVMLPTTDNPANTLKLLDDFKKAEFLMKYDFIKRQQKMGIKYPEPQIIELKSIFI